jgi:hypothetical protein
VQGPACEWYEWIILVIILMIHDDFYPAASAEDHENDASSGAGNGLSTSFML